MTSTHRVKDRNNDFVNAGSNQAMATGKYAITHRALVSFDLRALPGKARVSRALLQVYRIGKDRISRNVTSLVAYAVLRPWGEGRGSGSRWDKPAVLPGEASWLCSRHPDKWATPGCGQAGKDHAQDPAGKEVHATGDTGWVTVELSGQLVQGWLDRPQNNHGLLLRDLAEKDGSFCRFRTSEYPDRELRPRLVLLVTE